MSGSKEPWEPDYPKDAVSTSRQSRFAEDTKVAESDAPATLPSASRMQRQKSVSRRMLSRVKQGISGRPKIPLSIRPIDSETSLVRRLSSRRSRGEDAQQRSQSFEITRQSIHNCIDEASELACFADSSMQRSFTNSTVSTAEVLGDSVGPGIAKEELMITNYSSAPATVPTSSPISESRLSASPQPTPRPPTRRAPLPDLRSPGLGLSLTVPCVDLYVAMDTASVDIHCKRYIWVAIQATVRPVTTKVLVSNATNPPINSLKGFGASEALEIAEQIGGFPLTDCSELKAYAGAVTTLRLCFKPVQGCQLSEVIGQKSLKDLAIGQQCSLFVKLRVPKIRVRDSTTDPDHESLFIELESIVGTLKTEVLHVEARYRHSMLQLDNIVTVRHVCKIKRPKSDSRWSIAGNSEDSGAPAEVHTMLARYVAAHYSADRAMELLDRYLDRIAIEQPGVREIYESLAKDLHPSQNDTLNDIKPSVVVTDIDLNTTDSLTPSSEHFSTAPNTPKMVDGLYSQSFDPVYTHNKNQANTKSLSALLNLAPPLVSAPKTTTALSRDLLSCSNTDGSGTQETTESEDTARELWRHIRRTSLSTKQLQEMTPDGLDRLEASDARLRELRQKALANKRSIGAETLRAWKWEDNVQHQTQEEAPWM